MLTATQGKERAPILEEGIYTGVCVKVIDLGMQNVEAFKRKVQQVRITWEIIGKTVKIGEEDLPRLVSKEYTLSLNERSTLRKHLQSWRGKTFTAEELQGFDLRRLLGAGCLLQVMHKGDQCAYAAVDNIMALPNGTPKPEAVSTADYFDLDDTATHGVFETLSRFLQERISKAENFAATGLKLPERKAAVNVGDPPPAGYPGNSDFEEIAGEDDLPF